MNRDATGRKQPRRLWPWWLLAAVLLGTLLFVIWLWFAIQHVKRIKNSTYGMRQPSSAFLVAAGR